MIRHFLRQPLTLVLLLSVLGFSCGQNQTSNQTAKSDSILSTINKDTIATITADKASHLIGQLVLVKGKVASVFYAENSIGSPTFLNIEKDFPDNPIAVIIFEKELTELKINAQLYKGKTIIVNGKMELYKNEEKPYKNKPSIIIHSKDQIKIVDTQ